MTLVEINQDLRNLLHILMELDHLIVFIEEHKGEATPERIIELLNEIINGVLNK